MAIIIVTHRSASILGPCLARIPDGPPVAEVFVVDNGSRDSVESVVARECPRATVLLNPENEGFARACNQAARIATSDLLLFLNPDARMEEGALDSLTAHFSKSSPRPGILGAHLVGASGPGWSTFPSLANLFFRGCDALTKAPPANGVVDWVSGACLMIPRRLFEELQGFDERFFLDGEDLDLCQRCWLAGRPVLWAQEARVLHEGRTRWDAARLGRVYRAYLDHARHYGSRIQPFALKGALLALTLWRLARSHQIQGCPIDWVKVLGTLLRA